MEKVKVLQEKIVPSKLKGTPTFDESEYKLLENTGYRTKLTLMAIKHIFGGKLIK
jgi:hypothetical protein